MTKLSFKTITFNLLQQVNNLLQQVKFFFFSFLVAFLENKNNHEN